MDEPAVTIEQVLKELSDIITEMEDGDLCLEDSLARFEKGMQLAQKAGLTLENMEKKVEVIMDDNRLKNFDPLVS